MLWLLDKTVLQLSVTALFYLEDSRKIHLRGVRARQSKDTQRRAPQRTGERALALAPLFICLSLPGLPYVTGPARSAVCSTWGPHSGPRTFLCSIFVGFSLLCLLATAILDSFSPFYLPNLGCRDGIWYFSILTPNLCCDMIRNRGAYTHVTHPCTDTQKPVTLRDNPQ